LSNLYSHCTTYNSTSDMDMTSYLIEVTWWEGTFAVSRHCSSCRDWSVTNN